MKKSFNSSLLNGDEGNRQLIGIQILILMAWDRNIETYDMDYRLLSNQNLNYSRHTKVNDFLFTFFGEKVLNRISKSKINLFQNAFIYFTHFMEVDASALNRDQLVNALR